MDNEVNAEVVEEIADLVEENYLFPEVGETFSGIHSRHTDRDKTYQTLPVIASRRMPDVPVYVLVDRQTHSAAEAFAYDLEVLKWESVRAAERIW